MRHFRQTIIAIEMMFIKQVSRTRSFSLSSEHREGVIHIPLLYNVMTQLFKSLENVTVSHNKWQNYCVSFTVPYLCSIFKRSEFISLDNIKLPFWSARSNQQWLFCSHTLQHNCWRGVIIHNILWFWLCCSTLSINLHRRMLLLWKVWLWYVAISHISQFNQLIERYCIVISLSCCVNLQTSKIVSFFMSV